MALTAKLMDGRTWEADESGLVGVTRRYLIAKDDIPEGTAAEEVTSVAGLPAIGSAHPSNARLLVSGYSFAEGTGNNKKTLLVTVKYAPGTMEKITGYSPVEQWGWQSGSVQRDLTHDAVTGRPVLNSAGDPFDSVPQVDRPCPTFTKVVKSASRIGNALDLVNCVNASQVTIGTRACAVATLRVVQVNEERLIGDAKYLYRYTFAMQYMSNKVYLKGGSSLTEIGWDVAVVDSGCRIKNDDGTKTRLTDADEDGNQVPITAPVLLDGAGKRKTDTVPYVLRIQAYPRASIPVIFYNEPTR